MLFEDGPAEPVIEALRGYRNPDGGFGHALEPDVRCPSSQPGADAVRARDPGRGRRRGRRPGLGRTRVDRSDRRTRRRRPVRAARLRALPARAVVHGGARIDADARPGRASCHAGGATGDEWLDARHRLVLALDRGSTSSPPGTGSSSRWRSSTAVPDEERARAAIASLRRPRRSVRGRAGRRRRGRDAPPLDLSPRPGSRSRALVTEDADRGSPRRGASQSSARTAAGCSTGCPGRSRRPPTGAGSSRSARSGGCATTAAGSRAVRRP